MRALKFNISGKTAFFKKPDVNSYYYFTYGCIHKIALLGIIGAVLGLKGYAQQEKDRYPEFYEKLKNLEIAIVLPKNKEGCISKKIQIFNNSVGYASKEEGGNLIVKEQWLENPSWDIYIKINEDDLCKKIVDRFLSRRFIYIPYLGKNDHVANINEIRLVDITKTSREDRINSLIFKEDFKISKDQNDDWDYNNVETLWKYEEWLPIMLEEKTNQYLTKTMMATNMKLEKNNDIDLYKESDNVIFFF